MPFTLKQLRYFVATAETGSVTLAAQRVNISQPSVSAAIAELESRFGVDLFVRHHAQGLSLTAAGRELLTDAKSLLEHADDVRQGAMGLGQDVAGELHIGCFQTVAPLVLPRLIGTLSAHHPEISVKPHEHHVQGVLDGLRAGEFEFALTYDLGLDDDLEFETLTEVPLHCILAKSHPLAKAKAAAIADLIAYPMVLLGLPHSRDYFLSIIYGLGLQPRVAYETPNFEMVRGLVANSDAFAIMHSRPNSEWSLDGRRLVFLPIKDKLRPTRLGLVRLKKLRPTKRAAAFAELCRQHFARERG
jgi:DNA-binding transcriptional LysR family regulator